MFELAREYRMHGMAAYSQLQDAEFESERHYNYTAVKHQRFVGTGYFDEVQKVITSGTTSTTALAGSTETEQFQGMPIAQNEEEAEKAMTLLRSSRENGLGANL